MQIIYPVPVTPEQYVAEKFHQRIRCPECCPNCRSAQTLEALGYYWRYCSQRLTQALIIWVRRFLCRRCRVSVSCLPDFAQPYRFVNTPTIQAAFNGERHRPEVQHWSALIGTYWRRLIKHLPPLLRIVGSAFGRCSPEEPELFWKLLKRACGSLATATRQLVDRFRTCLFGTYRCHQPKTYQVEQSFPERRHLD